MRAICSMAGGALAALFLLAGPAAAGGDREFLCIKPATTSFDDNTVIACYSDAGCAYVQRLGADPVRDYDVKSVP